MKKQTGIDIIETSAKNSFKINETMEMITKKLIEKSGQGNTDIADSNKEKKGISLGDNNQQNTNVDNCCSFSLL